MLKSFFTVIGIVCGFIITFTGAITGISKIKEKLEKDKKKDTQNMKETLNNHTRDISEIREDMRSIKKRYERKQGYDDTHM